MHDLGSLPMAIPDFTVSGVLPPYLGRTPADSAAMSPYPASLVEIANKMCASNERKAIMRGLLDYRQQLATVGLQAGFQWLSGSFIEDIETLESRYPKDIDLVTFLHRPETVRADPDWSAFLANQPLLNPKQVKAAFRCDCYFVDLDSDPTGMVSQTRYWFGLFSHRRGGLWKGMLTLPLAVSADDTDALALVTS